MLSVVREEVEETAKGYHRVAQNFGLVQKLHHEVGDGGYSRKHPLGTHHDLSEVLKLEDPGLIGRVGALHQ